MRGARRDRSNEGHLPPRGTGRRALGVAAAALGLSLILAACSGQTGPGASASRSASPTPTTPAARIAIKPGNGSHGAETKKGIVVKVTDGKLVSVTVTTTKGEPVLGKIDHTGTWHSRWALNVSTRYTVRATAVDAAGRTKTVTSSFKTLTPHTSFTAQMFEGHNVTYGVGMPVMITFSRPIVDRRSVERSLRLWSSKPIVGAWYWDNSTTLYFRPRVYWPANTQVSFVGHLNGVEASPGVYGTHTLKQDWKIGRSLIVVASASNHKMQVYKNRKLFATWPISTGRPGKDTPNGTYLSIEKANPQHMVGPDYDIQVPYSVRFTWSGDFIHAAPWSVGAQGFVNVSHGCVNVAPDHAQTYYYLSIPGDPVTVTGSPKTGGWDDGWTVWFLSWPKVVAGSALHMAAKVGPDGSKFIDPSTLRPSRLKPPLSRPKPKNALAS